MTRFPGGDDGYRREVTISTPSSDHRVFRLYFVDAPESDRSVPGRVAEQAEYWDVDEEDVLAYAARARAFTVRFLKDEFTVFSNGYELGTFYDDNYEVGRYGVFVKAGDDGPYTYRVQQIRMWDLRFK